MSLPRQSFRARCGICSKEFPARLMPSLINDPRIAITFDGDIDSGLLGCAGHKDSGRFDCGPYVWLGAGSGFNPVDEAEFALLVLSL